MGVANTLKAGFGYVWSAVFKKKETNLKNFYINRFGAPLYKMFFEDYTEKVWGVNPDSISADWGAQRVKGLSLFKALWTMVKKPLSAIQTVKKSRLRSSSSSSIRRRAPGSSGRRSRTRSLPAAA